MMEDLAVTLPILVPAFVAGVLVLVSHIPLGHEVLRRGIIFLDLAIAQVAAFGVLLSRWLSSQTHGHGSHGHPAPADGDIAAAMLAYGAAMAGASAFYLVRHRSPRVQEALIGVMFVLAASGGVLLLANHPQGGEHLKEVLVGQILWVNGANLAVAAVISITVTAAWFALGRRYGSFFFYPLFAIAITMSTQLVGVFLVFASLIIPALASHGRSRPWLIAWTVGVAGYAAGLILSAILDQPSGALIVWTLTVCGILAGLLRPRDQRAVVNDSTGGV